MGKYNYYITIDETGQSPVNLYVGQIVYEIKQQNEWLMRFMVAQHLDALLLVSTMFYSIMDVILCFNSILIIHYQMLRKMSVYHSNFKKKMAT